LAKFKSFLPRRARRKAAKDERKSIYTADFLCSVGIELAITPRQDRQADQDRHRYFVVTREETQDVVSVVIASPAAMV